MISYLDMYLYMVVYQQMGGPYMLLTAWTGSLPVEKDNKRSDSTSTD